MAIDVSVVVPFFNPGADLDDCLASLSTQTLAREQYEVVLVDDGSTDGSAERADEWAAAQTGPAGVEHIAASGGPARPRNVGIDAARGRYVQFLDSDDRLAPDALRRLLEVADGSAADVVVGKLASDFRGIHHAMFRETVTERSLANFPLMLNLTVCKMFRRALLDDHAIRFPEGPRYIEDQHFCLEAYVHARSVAVVADTVCYFYLRRRTAGHNRGDAAIVPREYYRELAEIIWLLDDGVALATRQIVLTRFVRNEMLGRLRGPAMLGYDPNYRQELADEVRRLADELVTSGVEARLPAMHRMQLRLLRDGDVDGLVALAARLEQIRLRARTAGPRWQDGRLLLSIEAELVVADEGVATGDVPLRLEPDGSGWQLPEWLAPGTSAADRRLIAADDEDLDLDLATVSFVDGQLWSTTAGLRLEVEDGVPRVRGDVVVDPATVMGGRPLDRGRWQLRLRVAIAGLARSAPLRLSPAGGSSSAWLAAEGERLRSTAIILTGPIPPSGTPVVELDVDEAVSPLGHFVRRTRAEPTVDTDRQLVWSTSHLLGPPGQVDGANVLEPVDEPALGLRTGSATVLVTPDGSTVRAVLPALPGSSTAWSLLVRIGPIGGPAPTRMGFSLRQDAGGMLSVWSEFDER